MRVKIKAELDYYLAEPTDVLLAVEAIPMFDQILINGGQRGLLLGLAPDEAVRAAAARLVDLTA